MCVYRPDDQIGDVPRRAGSTGLSGDRGLQPAGRPGPTGLLHCWARGGERDLGVSRRHMLLPLIQLCYISVAHLAFNLYFLKYNEQVLQYIQYVWFVGCVILLSLCLCVFSRSVSRSRPGCRSWDMAASSWSRRPELCRSSRPTASLNGSSSTVLVPSQRRY